MQWLSSTTPAPAELVSAVNRAHRRIAIDRYRSRTNVTHDHIYTAYSWLTLSKIENDTIVEAQTNARYVTRALSRGVETEEALNTAREAIDAAIASNYLYTMLTFNTSTNAAATEALQTQLDADPDYLELNVRALVTTTPNHKVRIYKKVNGDRTLYVILNNLDTPAVVFKIATALLLNTNMFGEFTTTLAEGYLTGDGTKVHTAVTQYFAEYNNTRQERAIRDAINNMESMLTQNREREYTDKIARAQRELDDLYERITDYTKRLNDRKAEYLLYKLTDEDTRVAELKQFLNASKDKLSYLKYEAGYLTMVYNTPLLYYEPHSAQRYFDSTRENIMNSADPATQQLLKDIFINGSHTLMIQSGVTLNLTRPDVAFANPLSVLPVMSVRELNGMYNPHHYYYNCWGDNQSLIIRALTDHDYITAILQAFAAIAGINVTDTAVINKFVERELPEFKNTPCIRVNETQEIITFVEYSRRLTERASN